MSFVFFVLLSSGVVLAAEDATKNHRADKRQDDSSSLLFGGWRPVKSSGASQYHHGAAYGQYHDLISALPDKLDASSRFYAHALPSNYHKDIYSYYPRPAIKSTPKKNTPVYMERLKPKRQPQTQGGRNHVSGGGGGLAPQFIDIQKLDLKQIQGLQDILLQAKQLPLSQLNLLNKGGKQFDILELSVQTLSHDSHNTGSRNVNRYNRNRGPQRNNKGLYGRIPQNYVPAQLPLQYQYIQVPKSKGLVPQIHPKDISISPVNIPHPISAIDDILNIKNFQVIEVPVPASIPNPSGKNNRGSQYGGRNKGYSQPQYRMPSPKSAQKVSFPENTYYAHQAEQPRKHHSPPQQAKSGYSQQQPQIEAELIKLSEDDIQGLMKHLHLVRKNSQNFMKILPIADAAHKANKDQVHLFLAVPEENHGHQNVESSGYESRGRGAGEQGGGYENKDQYVIVPQQQSYPSHEAVSIGHNSGGYQVENQNQAAKHNSAVYEVQKQSGGNPYEQSYQSIEEHPNYGQAYQEVEQSNGYASADDHQDYGQADYNSPSQQQEVHSQHEQYIELISPQSENGYRREPVLAVEIQKGQSIEDAIKAIDPETLQRLGAHGKDGLEIEVVEVPVDEYSAESKKTETYVSSSNATTKAPKRKITVTSTTTVSKGKSTPTTTAKKT